MLAQSDLERFDRLHLQEVTAGDDDTASAFLAEFQSTAASLRPDERIKLEVVHARKSNMKLLKAVLADPHAEKVCALDWEYEGKEDVTSVIPLLLSKCPELASLQVYFKLHSAFDFVSRVLEHPSNKVNVLGMPEYTKGDLPRFFAALGRSKVSALTFSNNGSPEYARGLCDYLARDLLVRLEVGQVSPPMMASLVKCTRLVSLRMSTCEFSRPTAFAQLPKSIAKLQLSYCEFAGGFDWSFLADSSVRELEFEDMEDVEGRQLGRAVAVRGLDKLRFFNCDFVNETLAAAGVEIGRIKRLDIDGLLDDASIKLIALALQSPNSENKELKLDYYWGTMSSIANHLVPALKHPNCPLAKLSLLAYEPGHEAVAKAVEDKLRNRRALFALLQGQQGRRPYCPLRRLPVEMFRLVGEVLM